MPGMKVTVISDRHTDRLEGQFQCSFDLVGCHAVVWIHLSSRKFNRLGVSFRLRRIFGQGHDVLVQIKALRQREDQP